MRKTLSSFLIILLMLACSSERKDLSAGGEGAAADNQENVLPLTIDMADEALKDIISPEAKARIVGRDFAWTEGPLWLEEEKMLLFSEIPANKVHSWREGEGIGVYLDPAGYTGSESRGGELGSNGLLLDPAGKLVLCQHGDRRMARMLAPISDPAPDFETIVGAYESNPFNSPNDAVYDRQGNLYFTDPPYGLEGNMDDPAKAIPFQGVYRFGRDGRLELLLDSISRPNGIAFLPGEKELIIANSDPNKPHWYIYQLDEDGKPATGRIFQDASKLVTGEPGLPDGLKVRGDGVVFATGPGGVWVFGPSGKYLGRLKLGELTSNVALNAQGDVLFVTADSYVVMIPLK
ncbi:gluconolactonase [Cyclobacterium lianum]|uniref:Gluconolactonase n=1 Tax=Cyclobacterium lianum TaxID=388280 RepID=A0A1M7LA21_9BACT|nr:SMP-30/gluconolactonase/LRE family protein [Cyclobacterium lianum]SHM74727.1 gluconolactonase [Cyclobacterium lianum]